MPRDIKKGLTCNSPIWTGEKFVEQTEPAVLTSIHADFYSIQHTQQHSWLLLKEDCIQVVYIVFDIIPPGGAVIWQLYTFKLSM